jgi:hypothetical protein
MDAHLSTEWQARLTGFGWLLLHREAISDLDALFFRFDRRGSLYTDYTVPVDKLREEYRQILDSSPLWDRKVMAVQVTDAKERSVELHCLMSAGNPTTTFDLRCYVRERLIRISSRALSTGTSANSFRGLAG